MTDERKIEFVRYEIEEKLNMLRERIDDAVKNNDLDKVKVLQIKISVYKDVLRTVNNVIMSDDRDDMGLSRKEAIFLKIL